jgi:hypothetical protein
MMTLVVDHVPHAPLLGDEVRGDDLVPHVGGCRVRFMPGNRAEVWEGVWEAARMAAKAKESRAVETEGISA